MNGPPIGKEVPCPNCENTPFAIVPTGTEIIEGEENADGKVRVNCRECGERFLVYYRIE